MLQRLITDHIDLWTSAETKRSTTGRGSNKKIELTGIKKLRELILELAVRGLLVPQDRNDEPASVLLEKIAAEKAQLIKDGKIKKQKPLPIITDEEQPFELPVEWKWTRLGKIAEINPRNIAEDTVHASFIPMPLVTTSHDGKHGQETRTWSEIKKGYTHFADGDIGVAKITPCFENSKAAVFSGLKNGLGAGSTELHIARPYGHTLNPRYVLLYLKAPQFLLVGETKMTGTAGQKRVPKDFFAGNSFPLPPLAEQHRIVAKVDELMTLCDQLEQQQTEHSDTHHTLVTTLLESLSQPSDAEQFQAVWSQLFAHFDTLFTTGASIDQLKQTILQLAVMGKLVPQDPNDEPASILLEKIANEKAQLIKDGKIKKQKALSEISEDEKLFELPSSWKWVHWFEILALDDAAFKRGPFGSALKKDMFVSSGYKVYEQYCPINDDCSYERYFITDEKYESMKGFAVKENDYLVSCSGVTLGRITQVPKGFNEGIINQALLRVRINHKYIDKTFFKLLFRSPYFQKLIFDNSTGSAIPNVKGVRDLKAMPVPLLPINEQIKIVTKVDQLMALCDQLKAHLNQTQTTQQHLAYAVVEQGIKS